MCCVGDDGFDTLRYCQKYFLKNPVAYQALLPENETLSLESDMIRLPDGLPQSDIVFNGGDSETNLDLVEFFGRTQGKAYICMKSILLLDVSWKCHLVQERDKSILIRCMIKMFGFLRHQR